MVRVDSSVLELPADAAAGTMPYFSHIEGWLRAEIDRVASGEWPADDNPLVNAPHAAVDVLADEWSHPYSRTEAAYPAGTGVATLVADKHWPPVSRIDGAYGDRNLMCACPDPRAFESG